MSESSNQNWTPCEGGEISRMVDRLNQIRRKVAIQKAVTATVCVLALVTIGTVYWSTRTEIVPLSHGAALELLPDYQAGRLDADTMAQMKDHLAHCKACRVALEKLKSEESLLEPNSQKRAISHIPDFRDSLLAYTP